MNGRWAGINSRLGVYLGVDGANDCQDEQDGDQGEQRTAMCGGVVVSFDDGSCFGE
jgi:hypothetical protein